MHVSNSAFVTDKVCLRDRESRCLSPSRVDLLDDEFFYPASIRFFI